MFIAGDTLSLILVALYYTRWPKLAHLGTKHRPALRTLGPAIAVSKLLGAQLRAFLRSGPALALVDESSKRGKVREVAGLRPYTSYALYSGHLTCRVEEKEGGYPLPGTPGTEPRLRREPAIHSSPAGRSEVILGASDGHCVPLDRANSSSVAPGRSWALPDCMSHSHMLS